MMGLHTALPAHWLICRELNLPASFSRVFFFNFRWVNVECDTSQYAQAEPIFASPMMIVSGTDKCLGILSGFTDLTNDNTLEIVRQ